MVYQFPLPPLVLYSFLAQNAEKLSGWAASLAPTPAGSTFFNFLASHDGIGMRPTEGILTDEEQKRVVQAVLDHGGLVSYRDNGDGTRSPYELNISYIDALSAPDESEEVRAARMVAAHAILLSVVGVPGIYIHSLLGSRSDRAAAQASGINRRINRQKLKAACLDKELQGARGLVFGPLKRLLGLRAQQPAFAPSAAQEVCEVDPRLFCVRRTDPKTGQRLLAVVNVSGSEVTAELGVCGTDIVHNRQVAGRLGIRPYDIYWILEG